MQIICSSIQISKETDFIIRIIEEASLILLWACTSVHHPTGEADGVSMSEDLFSLARSLFNV